MSITFVEDARFFAIGCGWEGRTKLKPVSIDWASPFTLDMLRPLGRRPLASGAGPSQKASVVRPIIFLSFIFNVGRLSILDMWDDCSRTSRRPKMGSVSNDAPWSIYAQLETTSGWVGRPEPFKALSRKFSAFSFAALFH